MEKKWGARQAGTQHDIFEEKAARFADLQIKRRVFDRFMKNILICACARRIRFSIALREANYLKLVCFLYLKQEMAVAKHVKQMQKARNKRLRKKAMQALRTSLAVGRITTVNAARRDARASFHAF